MTINKKQLERIKAYLKEITESKARFRTEVQKARAGYYLTVFNEDSLLLYVIDVLKMFVIASEKYILETIINGKKLYNLVEIRTKDVSETKNRVCVKTIQVGEATRKEAIEIAENYIKENDLKFTDLAFTLI